MSASLILTQHGAAYLLGRLRAGAALDLRAGLHQNESAPQWDWTTANIQPAMFSGYVGLVPVVNWTPPVNADQGAVIAAEPILWRHDGGVATGWVLGYYVVDADGRLVWADSRPGPPLFLGADGDLVIVTPTLSIVSRY